MVRNASSDSANTQAQFAYKKGKRLANLSSMPTLADRIKTMREAEGFSQEALGKLVGVSRQAIGQWERGETETLTTARVEALAGVLQVSPAWLAFEIGSARGAQRASDSPSIDVKLLGSIIEVVSAALARRKKTLPPQKLGLLVARIYEHEARHGTPQSPIDQGYITSLLELTL